MPLALVLVLATWIHRLFRQLARNHRERVANSASASSSLGTRTGVFHYILRHTRRNQLFLLATTLVSLPLMYAGLDLPKLSIINAISSGNFPLYILHQPITQTNH